MPYQMNIVERLQDLKENMVDLKADLKANQATTDDIQRRLTRVETVVQLELEQAQYTPMKVETLETKVDGLRRDFHTLKVRLDWWTYITGAVGAALVFIGDRLWGWWQGGK